MRCGEHAQDRTPLWQIFREILKLRWRRIWPITRSARFMVRSEASGRLPILSNVVASSVYIGRLKMTIEQLHRCSAEHVASSPVHEVFNGKTVWEGDVEIFRLEKHPRAKRCFAWSHGDRIVTVLEIPPVNSPQTAVRSQIVKEVKDSYSQ